MTDSTASFSMEDFEKALGQFDYEFSKGQIVTGKAVAYESDFALIDIGGKSPGILPKDEASVYATNDLSTIVPVDEAREFLIIREQNADGQVTLSLRQLEQRKIWQKLVEMQESKESFQVKVTGSNKGGVQVNAMGLRGFIPRSHLANRGNIEGMKGQTLSVLVLDMEENRNRIVLSNRLATRAASFSQLQIGQIVEGTITGIRPFGAFVEFDGNSGLLHVSQISNKRVDDVNKVLNVGDTIKVLIADLNEGENRIALTTKHFESFPGEMLENSQKVMEEVDDRAERARKTLMGSGDAA
ncbi:S1 RNA-binding domain-containing protein [filamentous cyanobacterium LEGE 11480]|uniref:S1 RNA-binding domain-containing protein n=1 Tax=Romeriopsis navalis LEGE 11480 TaxID=2777977 RepID=A0A928VPE1_9CYAN|nr:S1 RNA-binding domain-containing protein [Romeriopsis navalis]MBE9032338.1 S1 RNA-binding domain-containing protein [Romeriopsis navalis LEGE 11480]